MAFASAQSAQDRFRQGEDLFLRNQSAQAIPLLESVVREDAANMKAVLYLGLAYHQQNRLDEAIALLRKNLPRSGELESLFAFNLGNAYFANGAASFAEQFYTQAIAADPGFGSAFLHRANARVRTQKLSEAIEDYTTYLSIVPNSSKRSDIERMIAAIQEGFAITERQRQAEETARREAQERQQRLLEEVSASLQAAADATQGMSAGADEVLRDVGEFELE